MWGRRRRVGGEEAGSTRHETGPRASGAEWWRPRHRSRTPLELGARGQGAREPGSQGARGLRTRTCLSQGGASRLEMAVQDRDRTYDMAENWVMVVSEMHRFLAIINISNIITVFLIKINNTAVDHFMITITITIIIFTVNTFSFIIILLTPPPGTRG